MCKDSTYAIGVYYFKLNIPRLCNSETLKRKQLKIQALVLSPNFKYM